MGGDTAIRKDLEEAAPRAFVSEPLVLEEADGPWLRAQDALTYLHHVRGPRHDFTFTLDELLFEICENHMKLLREGHRRQHQENPLKYEFFHHQIGY